MFLRGRFSGHDIAVLGTGGVVDGGGFVNYFNSCVQIKEADDEC